MCRDFNKVNKYKKLDHDMNYNIFINNQLYKTVDSSNGYNYVEIIRDIQRARDAGELGAFDLSSGLAVRVEQQ